jgi:hypothetical protein
LPTLDSVAVTLTGTLTPASGFHRPVFVSYDSAKDRVFVNLHNSDALAVISVADSASPTLLGSVTDSTNLNAAQQVCYDAARELVYVSTWWYERFTVVDVSDSASPAVVGSLYSSSNFGLLCGISYDQSNLRAFVCAADYGVNIVTVATETSPAIVGSLVLSGARLSEYDSTRNLIIVVHSNSLSIISVADSSSPSILGAVISATYISPYSLAYDPINERAFTGSSAEDSFVVVDPSAHPPFSCLFPNEARC